MGSGGFAVVAVDVFDHIKAGDTAISSGDAAAADSAFSTAIRMDPTNKLAYTKRASARMRLGLLAGALHDLTSALDIEPASIAVRLLRGDVYLRLCSFDDAAADFQAVLTVKADHDAALQGQEKVTTGKGHLQTAQVRPWPAAKLLASCNCSSVAIPRPLKGSATTLTGGLFPRTVSRHLLCEHVELV
jgi:tetratricopeptide (TPR) repeat protein